MANISTQNNIRFAIDNLSRDVYGILLTKAGSELDFSNVTSIPEIILDYYQPNLTEIYLAFFVNNSWCGITSSGWLDPFILGSESSNIFSMSDNNFSGSVGIFGDNINGRQININDFDTLRVYGNTPTSLLEIENFDVLAGKKVGVAIGLYTMDFYTAIPKIKMGFKVKSSVDQFTTSEYSPVYDFEKSILLGNVSSNFDVSDNAEVKLFMRAISDENEEIEYTQPENLKGKRVNQIQFRADYSVQNINIDYANLLSAKLIYTPGKFITTENNSGEIVSITQNWYMDISQVRMTIKHKPLINSTIRAFCAFRNEPVQVNHEILGQGDGTIKIFTLQNISGINYDTIKLYYDNQPVLSTFDFNDNTGKITCTPPDGAIVSCDYEYNWGNETWHEMTLSERYELEEQEASEFKFTISKSEKNKSVCAVKISLALTEGIIIDEQIGIGRGVMQTYKLSHKIKEGNINIFVNGLLLSPNNWLITDETDYVRIAAPKNSRITANYTWISETPEIYQFAAVFNE